jgi:N-carbamoyl-L-amino-acid hydrolase
VSRSRDPQIDAAKLWSDLMALGDITEPDRPYTRRSFSARFLDGRDWLRRRLTEAGLTVRLDAGGNLIGRLPGQDASAGTLMIGSHSDSVPSGGRFDGMAGVIVALEIARALADAGRKLRHSLEVVDFLAEEPSDYGLSCVGSRAMAGRLSADMLIYRNAQGETLAAAIDRIGGNVAQLASARRNDIAAFLELHIEQGRILEQSGTDLGIVSAIASVTRVEIQFDGRADHAGTTPMDLRRDAGLAAALVVAFVAEEAQRFALMDRGHFVATTGVLEISPNASNVVPGSARLVVDIRGEDEELTDSFLELLDAKTIAVAEAAHVDRPSRTLLSKTKPTQCDAALRDLLRTTAQRLGYSTLDMASGAGHDAAFMASFTPTAMIFVPCRDGRSHAPDEWAEPDAIGAGAATLLEAILRLDAPSA